ncbi:MAG TPA: acetyl-CoA C-acyltransferase FadI [Polyangiaceae bacterium]|jgi:acetyl-CoA acyltransferase|nr:acetyl-CoA C-acyltransferase FadI [Polyangiaceae bacterium]
MAKNNGDRRVAIVAGLRTPFAKQGSVYRDLTALDLGKIVVAELLQRTGIDPIEIQQVVYGQVIPSLSVPNIAREIVLGTGMPRSIEAYSVARACATSYQSTVNVAESILAGVIDCGIAGGADSASDVPMAVGKRLSEALVKVSKARSFTEKLRAFAGLGAADLMPIAPALKEPSTGLTMGESAEKMAKENGISREDQDIFAHRSHTLAAQAWADGRLRDEVMPVFVPPRYDAVDEDNLVRKDSELDAYAKLKPVFDRRYGTVTAGNSSPLTDGASALLLMTDKKAKALGLDVLGYLRSYAFAAVDPAEQLLMGPAYAAPLALDRAELKLKNMDLIDMHEAFAAQVLSNIQAFESDTFSQQKLGRDKRLGKVDWEKLNVSGGSIALGHPFAATGARQISQTLRELRRRGGEFALCTACAAGGLGAAMVLEAA